MKSSLRKLRGFALLKSEAKGSRDLRHHPALHDELARATKDMQDMRSCYDSLLSAAAATANSAYEFSEALRELGACLLERTVVNDDEETARILLLLGKAQFELQKLADSYRMHIIQTITAPSESLLKELQTVEEMKRVCDDKRDLYKLMLAAQREKGRSRNIKGESFSAQQLQAAQEDYDEEAALFMFRLKSLKQGQSRSLLTQASRHHAAQLSFFRKGVKSLEIVEPQVKVVAEHQHIDYHFTGLEDDTDDDEDDDYYDRELSFDDARFGHGQYVSTLRMSMDVDQVEHSTATITAEHLHENHGRNQTDHASLSKGPRLSSLSAPLFPDTKFEPSNRIKAMAPSPTKKFHTYVLPTPLDAKAVSDKSVSASQLETKDGFPAKLWHSSPLDSNKIVKDFGDEDDSSPTGEAQLGHRHIKVNNGPINMPPSLAELSSTQVDPRASPDPKNIKRQTNSLLSASKGYPSKTVVSANPSLPYVDYPPAPSAVLSHGTAAQHSASRKVSPTASPPPTMSPPKISELHELPRPPIPLVRGTRPGLIGHSAPLVPGGHEFYSANKKTSHKASPLPQPPVAMARSYSIPSGSERTSGLTVAKLLGSTYNADIDEDGSSARPLMNKKQISKITEAVLQATKVKGFF